ncbi:hypothetical protein P280DRAFT_469019 [Massarina eburnea CBS 473.64]|uniref:Uncharacterized protein n=1 Tax=Massarina eburnea CBS 473.64 TaxID=1395130 RepID=A0A6A6S4Q6_9PLEO|nr:hypothetical protein P280DRAFT_469019 [Massarina eburnea CBS 473.64]
MSRRSKISVIIFLSLPLAVTAIGIYRLQNFVAVLNLPPGTAEDPYNVRNSLSNIESNLGVLAACGPTIKWILGRLFPYFASDSTRPTNPTNPYTPTRPSRVDHSSRGYQKSQDIELTRAMDDLDRDSTCETRHKDDDARSDEQAITEGMKKTHAGTVTEDWNADEIVGERKSGAPSSKTAEPRAMV